jgi:ABC-type multidrug transport system ATPase subunit
MDEVSNCVDPIVRQRIYNYLKSLKNTSIILITHRVDEAEKICNRVAIMAEGTLQDVGEPNILK